MNALTPASWFRRLWPRSLAGQLIMSLLAALLIAQIVSAAFFASERHEAIINARRELVMQRTASLVRMLDLLPRPEDPALTQSMLAAATSTRLRFWVAPDAAAGDGPDARDNLFTDTLLDRLDGPRPGPVLVRVVDREDWGPFPMPDLLRRWHRDSHDRPRHDDDDHGKDDDDHERHRADHSGDDHGPGHMIPGLDGFRAPGGADRPPRMLPAGLVLSVPLSDGRWLNGELAAKPARLWGGRTMTVLLLTVLAISLVSILIVRRLTRPLNDLAAAADALGRGEAVAPLTPTGPGEIRRTTDAFNRMQERLHRFVADRTAMLAAISHDLRTPLTSLRLRAEFIKDDAENREKILKTLDEMERITEATLAFARDAQGGEAAREEDVAKLCAEVAYELTDAGMAACFDGAREPIRLTCQPTAIKRAVRNLAENAARYGAEARIGVQAGTTEILISVEDDGPGIPEDQFDTVFEPFTRLESSRSQETGGVGLGLAIARTVVRAHGGDIRLENRVEGGLKAVISLPLPHRSTG